MPLPVIPPLRGSGGSPAPTPNAIAFPSWTVEVSWSAAARGVFVIGTSELDSVDTLAVSAFDDAFGGDYDNVTAATTEMQVEHGRSDDLQNVNGGTANVTLRDPTALFSPENQSSPLYADLSERLHPIRILSHLGGNSDCQFYGWVRRLVWRPKGRSGVTTLECVDLLYWLERTSPIISATGPTTVGAAIGLVLDAVGWIDPTMRNLQAGDPIADFSSDGTVTALQLVSGLLDYERGTFYVSAAGVATYETRHARTLKPTAGTLTNEMRAVSPGVDADRVKTRVTVTRSGGVAQVIEDEDAASRWGPSDGPSVTSPYPPSDEAAAELGRYIISQQKSPRSPLRSLAFDGRTTPLLEQLLGRGFGDKVQVSEAEGGTDGLFHVEQTRMSVTTKSGLVTGSWIVSRATANPVFLVEQSLLDSADVVAY